MVHAPRNDEIPTSTLGGTKPDKPSISQLDKAKNDIGYSSSSYSLKQGTETTVRDAIVDEYTVTDNTVAGSTVDGPNDAAVFE